MKPTVKKIARRLLSESARGAIDYFRFPERRMAWGGPFNGQTHRANMFCEINDFYRFGVAFETGTYRGTTTEYIARHVSGTVWTVELDPWSYGYCAARFFGNKKVFLQFGDSRDAIAKFARWRNISSPIFFYLDAHWGEDLPLLRELELIFANWSNPIVMIDDFKVEGDADYSFDDYADKRLCVDYIAPVIRKFRPRTFAPSLPGKSETGARRGSIVLIGRDAELPTSLLTMQEIRVDTQL
jgi:hypothetical protein